MNAVKEKKAEGRTDPAEVLAWLRASFGKACVPFHVYDNYGEQDGYLWVPVYVGGSMDAYEVAKLMVKIQEKWNRGKNREDLKVFLNPASSPAVMRRLAKTRKPNDVRRRLKTVSGNGRH